jgi:hypothetical protein
MHIIDVVNGLMQRGLKIEVKNGMLMVGPRDQMSEETRQIVREHTPDILAFMLAGAGDDVMQWRLTAMLIQLLPLSWPCTIPTLRAAPDAQTNKEDCASCGEVKAVGEGDSFVCGPCARAKSLALDLWLQRPAQNVRAA